MSATTLLVLGVVRILQPAHGYLIRRELLSWNVERWANINPGSIYNALRSAVRAGHLAEVAVDERKGGPGRTTYRLTPEGEMAFKTLLRRFLWEPEYARPENVLAALCFIGMLRRDELRAAIAGRIQRLEAGVSEVDDSLELLRRERFAPPYVAEQFLYGRAHLLGELEWCRAFDERLAAGHYRFADDPGVTDVDPNGRWYGPLDEPRPADV